MITYKKVKKNQQKNFEFNIRNSKCEKLYSKKVYATYE